MRFSQRRRTLTSATRVLTVAGVVGVLGLLGACGDKSTSSTPTPAASATAAPSGAASSSAAPSSASPSASPSASKAPTVKASSNLDAVNVTGAYGATPKITFKPPFRIDKTQTKVLSEGKGAAVREGTSVEVDYLGVDARTGKTFDTSFEKGRTPIAFPLDQVIPGFKKGLLGQKQGSRVLIAMTGEDGYDASGGNPSGGISVGDTLFFVVDITTATLDAPSGTTVAPVAGLPTVTGGTGTPQVTIPDSSPPTKLTVQPLIKGSGPAVKAADAVTLRYTWVTWSDGKVIESDYGKPAETATLSSQIKGFSQGLVGQTVGSRVLLVVPPSLGYPNGNASPKINKNETLVFVVDVLFTQTAQQQQ